MNLKKHISIISIIIVTLILPFTILQAGEQSAREIPDTNATQIDQMGFDSASYQSAIESSNSLSELAKAQSQVGLEDASMGFAAKSDEAKFFLIGSLYSEALAHLQSGEMKAAADRLQFIENQFVVLQTPSSLYSYISKVRTCIALEKYKKAALFDMLSLFQPFFEDYAVSLSQDKQALFRAGSWLMDMSLTAAAEDKELIKQAKPQLDYFIKEMKRMDAPKGVLKAYDDISKIAAKDEIQDKDVKKVLKQVKRIQTILG